MPGQIPGPAVGKATGHTGPPMPGPPGPPGPFPPGPPGMGPGPPGLPVYYQPGHYAGPPGPPPPRHHAKRWHPPPSRTPGSQGQPSSKQFLWLHSAWCDNRLTVVLSLGSREITIAMSLPHAVLASTQGLSTLIQRLESELDSELQDSTRDASRKFLVYRHSRGAIRSRSHFCILKRLTNWFSIMVLHCQSPH